MHVSKDYKYLALNGGKETSELLFIPPRLLKEQTQHTGLPDQLDIFHSRIYQEHVGFHP